MENDRMIHDIDRRMKWKRNYDADLLWLYNGCKRKPHLPDINKPSTPKWVQRNSLNK